MASLKQKLYLTMVYRTFIDYSISNTHFSSHDSPRVSLSEISLNHSEYSFQLSKETIPRNPSLSNCPTNSDTSKQSVASKESNRKYCLFKFRNK